MTSVDIACWFPCTTLTSAKTSLKTSFSSLYLTIGTRQFFNKFQPLPEIRTNWHSSKLQRNNTFTVHCSISTYVSETETEFESGDEYDSEEEGGPVVGSAGDGPAPPVRMRRRRYRKQYPGEKKGITEEMRFVALKLRNNGKGKPIKESGDEELEGKRDDFHEEKENNVETWEPSMEGFLKYLVDTNLVFSTIERIIDDSSDVSYAYFRKTGLERYERLSKDLEWFNLQGHEIPQPSNPGVAYVQYLEELADKSPPLFLSHFYNIYFSHIAGGQVIAKQVSEKLLEGKQLEVFTWDGDAEELLRDAREKLNALGEHWSRDEKNKCLREATKAFRFLGQIVRLIIL